MGVTITPAPATVGLVIQAPEAALGTAASAALDTDQNLAANSDLRVPSQKAIKAYVDLRAAVVGTMVFQAAINCSADPNYPSATKGYAWVVDVAGKIGGASGISVEVGDVILATATNAGGTQAAVGTSWTILEHNLAGALLASNNLSDVASVPTAQSNLGLVIGTNVQAFDSDLAAIAALTTTSFGRSVLTVADGPALRTLAGLGTAAVVALSIDGTLAGNSDGAVPSEKAVKSYVDNKTAGLSWKTAVRAGTTVAGTLASSFANGSVIDGVTLATGDRILIKNQATASENGIYVVNVSGAPTRATDADSAADLVNATCYISEGTTLADQQWTCSTNAPITLGTTGLTFVISNSGGGTTTNSLTFNNGGAGAASGTAFNGSAAHTVSYNTVGATRAGAITSGDLTIATARLAGRTTAATGAVEEISVGSGLSLTAGVLNVSATVALLASPAFTGTPTAPTPAALDNDTSVATTAFVQSELMPSVQAVASTATFTPVAGAAGDDAGVITALAAALTIAAPTGTPLQMQPLILRIKDNGTARALTWNAIFRAIGVTLPTTTVLSKTLYVGFLYNATDTKWDCVLVRQEA